MQVRLVRRAVPGRSDRDGGPRAVVINETFANRYWPNQNPVGKHMVFGTPGEHNPWVTIVGVVGDMRRRGLQQGARLEMFFSTTQNIGRDGVGCGFDLLGWRERRTILQRERARVGRVAQKEVRRYRRARDPRDRLHALQQLVVELPQLRLLRVSAFATR